MQIHTITSDNKEKFENELLQYLNNGYEIVNSNMSMMNTNVAHRPAFYALLIKK